MNAALAPWVEPYLRRAQAALGLQVWEIQVIGDENPDDDDSRCIGRCYAVAPYLHATIRLRPSWVAEPGLQARTTVIHELLHLTFAHLQQVENSMVRDLAPKKSKAFANRALIDALEQTIVRLARSLVVLIPFTPEPTAPAAPVQAEQPDQSDADDPENGQRHRLNYVEHE